MPLIPIPLMKLLLLPDHEMSLENPLLYLHQGKGEIVVCGALAQVQVVLLLRQLPLLSQCTQVHRL